MNPDDPTNPHPLVIDVPATPSPPASTGHPHEIALDFPIGDGRIGRCHVRLFPVRETPAGQTPDREAHDENPAPEPAPAPAGDALNDALILALVHAPPGGSGFDLPQYAASIAGALCHRENIPPDRLLYIDHDQDRGARLSQWAVLLGPHVMQSYGSLVSEGAFDNEAFCLVAFDFAAGALTNPRFTPISRLDIEGILGHPFA